MVTTTFESVFGNQILPAPVSNARNVSDDFVINEMYLGQTYFWSKVWQVGEREADKDIKLGRTKTFNSAKDTIKYLHSKRKK
jgi:hypothetical protein